MGRGKADLLAQIERSGSIAEAAKKMDMSYMRAWTLIKTMNQCFKEPVVSVERGGSKGGGAMLTNTGKAALALYRTMEERSLLATQESWREFQKLLRS